MLNGKTIGVDLTPVLPGGENGGAKIFVLELIKRLSTLLPNTHFVLLTQWASHNELVAIERANISLYMVISRPNENDNNTIVHISRFELLKSVVGPRIPAKIRPLLVRVLRKLKEVRTNMNHRRSFLEKMGVDLLFCPFTAPTFAEKGIPTVCTIYDLQYKTYPQFFDRADVVHRDETFRSACKYADALAVISDFSRDQAILYGCLDQSKIKTIYLRMAKRIEIGAASNAYILEKYTLDINSYIIYPANFWQHKNHEMLLTAFSLACKSGLPKEIKLVCTGAPGARMAFLQSAAIKLGVGSRVLFPGFVPDDELSTLLTHCCGVVFPSLFEGFGLPVVEAMSMGVPVACSNTTSLPEVAGGAAIYFDPRNPVEIAKAIVALVTDKNITIILSAKGKERAGFFSDSDQMAREYIGLFRSALMTAKSTN